MKKIFLNNDTFYYKGKLDNPINNRIFLSKLKSFYYNHPQYVMKRTTDEEMRRRVEGEKIGFRPHDQLMNSQISFDETRNILNFTTNLLSQEFNTSKDYVFESWTLFANNSESKNFFHIHEHVNYITNQWSLCYYVQMPNNLIGDEGKLKFKTSDNLETAILPEESDLIIFPGNLLHTPVDTTKSTKERIVFCSNISLLQLGEIKTSKSIL